MNPFARLAPERLARWSRWALAQSASVSAEQLAAAEDHLTALLLFADSLEREALHVSPPPPSPALPAPPCSESGAWARSTLAELARERARSFCDDSPVATERRSALLELACVIASVQ